MKRRFFHGGKAGLDLGDLLMPPDITGEKPAVEHLQDGGEWALSTGVVRTDRVYVTPSYDIALMFAALRGGWIYELETFDEPEPDPDWLGEPGLSMMIQQGKVIARHEPLKVEIGKVFRALRIRLDVEEAASGR